MKNQTIPFNHEAVVDDALIRIVNENHARSVRQKQLDALRKRQALDRFMNNLFYTALGAALGVLTFVLILAL